MKNFLLIILIVVPSFVLAQQKKAAPVVPIIKGCHTPSDTSATSSLKLEDIQYWADKLPLEVKCGNGKMYFLSQFTFTIIKQNPMQTLDYGTGNNGIPILARKAIDKLEGGDTILIRDVSAKDDKGNETKLSTIAFKVTKVELTK